MKIAVDLDDTLSVVDRVTRASGYIAREGLPYRLVDPDALHIADTFDWNEEEATKFIRAGGLAVFTEAEARKGARETLTAWREAGHTVTVLTARQRDWFGNPSRLTRDWLEKRKIPFDEIVAEETDKGRYCAEHGISVLIDNDFATCAAAQERGVYAVLAVRRANAADAGKIAFRGASWAQIAETVSRIAETVGRRDRLLAAAPARRSERYDGWELRFDEWTGRRGNCVIPLYPSRRGVQEKLAAVGARYAAEGKPCRFLLTEADAALAKTLRARGFRFESAVEWMRLDRIAEQRLADSARASDEPTAWREDYRVVRGGNCTRDVSRGGDRRVFVSLYEGERPVAVASGVLIGDEATLFDVCVRSDMRRRGYGRAVVESTLAACRARGATHAVLQAEKDNFAAKALYRAAGFSRFAEYFYLTDGAGA
ncbi:MAG: GNAT family N-acetyltransferase [Candidatus Gallimonas sp.]